MAAPLAPAPASASTASAPALAPAPAPSSPPALDRKSSTSSSSSSSKASGESRGTKRRLDSSDLLPLDAPIQKRTYYTTSALRDETLLPPPKRTSLLRRRPPSDARRTLVLPSVCPTRGCATLSSPKGGRAAPAAREDRSAHARSNRGSDDANLPRRRGTRLELCCEMQ